MNYKHFNSLDEFCTQPFVSAENRQQCKRDLGNTEKGERWVSQGGGYWLGDTTDANVAAARVTQGWPEGAQRVLSTMEALEVPQPMDVQRRVTRSDQGDELDIHAVYRGGLDKAWSTRKRRNGRGPFCVRIIAQTNMLADFSGEQLFWRGAATVKAVDMLTAAGYSVEVLGVLASEPVDGISGPFAQSFPLKEMTAPLDINQLAGVVCNAGFHRLFGFRAYFAAAPRHHYCGSATSDRSGRIIESLKLDGDGVPTFRVPYQISNKSAAEQWLRDMISKLESAREEVTA